MIEFDENLNPIEGGKPSGDRKDDMPPIYQGPAQEPPRPSVGPRGTEGPPPTPPPPPPRPAQQMPPPPPPPPPGRGIGTGILWVAVIGLIIITGLAIFWTTSSGTTPSDELEGITVTGEGIAYATADIARVRFGVQETANSVDTVRDRLNDKIDRVRDELDELNIDDKDIKTVEYNLYPERDYRYNPSRITGYTGRHSYLVTIRDLDDINDVVDAITRAGANDVSNVTFDLDDPDEYVEEAREEAIEEAKDKAADIAKSADIKLGKLISIRENVGGITDPYRYAYDGLGGGEEVEVGPNIEPGSQEIRVTVTLTYKIGW